MRSRESMSEEAVVRWLEAETEGGSQEAVVRRLEALVSQRVSGGSSEEAGGCGVSTCLRRQ